MTSFFCHVFPTAFHATELACVSAGKTVAVFGACPVGLLSAYCSLLKGASEVYLVDNIPERLEKGRTWERFRLISATASR
jgi:glutathione-independent formaldehyde dehydrogenase